MQHSRSCNANASKNAWFTVDTPTRMFQLVSQGEKNPTILLQELRLDLFILFIYLDLYIRFKLSTR